MDCKIQDCANEANLDYKYAVGCKKIIFHESGEIEKMCGWSYMKADFCVEEEYTADVHMFKKGEKVTECICTGENCNSAIISKASIYQIMYLVLYSISFFN